jgi:myo-inositol-1(or 4)-monophosphatase
VDRAGIDARLGAAETVVRQAGALALHYRGGALDALGIEAKGRLDLVTAADRAVERLVVEQLGKVFGDGVLGEEFGGAIVDHLWVVDPIDGTFNYIHGLPHWAISLAFVADGATRIGIVFNPARDEFFIARDGGGAFLNNAPIRASDAHLDRPLFEIGRSAGDDFASYAALLDRVIASGAEFRRMGSAALGLVSVACGRTDAYYQRRIHAWDVLAGLLIAREAGAWTNDFLAHDGLRRGNPVLACVRGVREQVTALFGVAE